MFMLYLICAGTERLAVEFIRLNPIVAWGLSQAQWIALNLTAVGVAGWFLLGQRGNRGVSSFPQ